MADLISVRVVAVILFGQEAAISQLFAVAAVVRAVAASAIGV